MPLRRWFAIGLFCIKIPDFQAEKNCYHFCALLSRHTHATELSEAGVNIKEIQRRLGHSTMDVTSKRYLHATKAMEDESVEKMNQMFAD